ncbi:hypothetical protein Skr01_08470 [Sphaerisporangium krabiense]|uniref:Uncharacterized protein n=1 Tax=Sphaerisporangium krabiense TaxID=763782 RepID=A0A7W9DVD2_9ACTN|nr:hypothetical protein [Sphaerisporangium krabiense]MBB5631345.1 hypothetical protein [Sphaerisporangium krabiense]GII60762.1 hypothetical protein Skr01_08470 [Sphaerisporangium krabiense]
MKPTRKMWISAAVTGVVLAGGISVAAAAASGRVEQADKAGSKTSETYGPGEAPGQIPGPEIPQNAEPTRSPETFVVTDPDVNGDPRKVAEFWTEKRLEDAEPLPIPVLTPEKTPTKKPTG